MTDYCPRFGKLFGGCRFEPRYDTSPTITDIPAFEGTVQGMRMMLQETKSITYVCDVCVRCGKTVTR